MRKKMFSLCLILCLFVTCVNYKTVTVMAGDCDYSDCDDNDKTCKLNNAKKKKQCLENEIENAKSNQEEYWKLASEWAKEAENILEIFWNKKLDKNPLFTTSVDLIFLGIDNT